MDFLFSLASCVELCSVSTLIRRRTQPSVGIDYNAMCRPEVAREAAVARQTMHAILGLLRTRVYPSLNEQKPKSSVLHSE